MHFACTQIFLITYFSYFLTFIFTSPKIKADTNISVISRYWRIIPALRFVCQARDSSVSQLQEAITATAAGFWVKSVFCIACIHPAPSAGVSVTVSVCRNGNEIKGCSGEGLDREVKK